jgi:hypothetical protein
MKPAELFVETVRACESLPAEVRSRAAEARAVEESTFDESYVEFLDTQIRLSPRGPKWTARLKQRREALKPFCRMPLIYGVIPLAERFFSIHVLPERKTVIYFEEYDFPYPTET